MPKVILNPVYEFVSGKLGSGFVAMKIACLEDIENNVNFTVFRRNGNHGRDYQNQKNIRQAMKITVKVWQDELSDEAKL